MSDQLVWQQVEFGSYAADLPLWVELAEAADGPVLELGAGGGRVALHLAAHGQDVIALERDPQLTRELELCAEQRGVQLAIVSGDLADAAGLQLPSTPALAIGPLHVIQMLDVRLRPALLRRLAALLAPGGLLALTVVDESTLLSAGAASTQILPDMLELDGWVYSSEPLWVQVGEDTLRVRRLRERVSPDGEMKRAIHDEVLHRISAERLTGEAEAAGFAAAGTHRIASGPNEADSIAVLLEALG